MRLRDRRIIKPPELMIIPMIDIMFFLLGFVMLGTMYMIELKTIPIKLPTATNTTLEVKSTFSVTMKEDGSLWLEDKKIDLSNLLMQAKIEKNNNPNFAIILRADKNIDYGKVVKLLDQIKGAGITRFGLATDSGV